MTEKCVIKRVYFTKGDNWTNDDGIKNDKKLAILLSDDTLYWLSKDFTHAEEVNNSMLFDFIHVHNSFKNNLVWSKCVARHANQRDYSDQKAITKINKHHDDIFTDGSSYMKKSVKSPTGSIFWEMSELHQELMEKVG